LNPEPSPGENVDLDKNLPRPENRRGDAWETPSLWGRFHTRPTIIPRTPIAAGGWGKVETPNRGPHNAGRKSNVPLKGNGKNLFWCPAPWKHCKGSPSPLLAYNPNPRGRLITCSQELLWKPLTNIPKPGGNLTPPI